MGGVPGATPTLRDTLRAWTPLAIVSGAVLTAALDQTVVVTVGDVSFLVRVHQLIGQPGYLGWIGGVQVQHSRAKVACFPCDCLSEAP